MNLLIYYTIIMKIQLSIVILTIIISTRVHGYSRIIPFENIDSLALQTNDTVQDEIHLRTYLDFHYVYDNDMPGNRKRPYGSNPLHVNQFDIGYAFAELTYKTKNFRSTISFNSGCIVERMYELESEMMKHIREMSGEYFIGNGVSIEGGIMPAMYGFEGFINKENWFSTRAVMTDFAPDYDLGVRLNYRYKNHWSYRVQIANGWQTLREVNNNKAVGTLIRYDSPKVLINWGTMTTNESSVDSINLERFYSNFFAKFHLGKKWQIAPLWDAGFQRDSFNFNKLNFWTSACINIRYQWKPKLSLAARYEYFYDPKQIIPDVITNTPNGFQYKGGSICVEYAFHPYASFRLETRYAHSRDKIYMVKNKVNSSNSDLFVMGQFLFELHHDLKVVSTH